MHTQEIATSQSEPLWRIGPFACALALRSEPLFLSVLRDDESILEVAVHSSLEAEERADAFRDIVQQYLVTDEPTGGPPAASAGYTICPSCGSARQSRPMMPRLANWLCDAEAAVTCGEKRSDGAASIPRLGHSGTPPTFFSEPQALATRLGLHSRQNG